MIIDHVQSERQRNPNVETSKGSTQPIIEDVQLIRNPKSPTAWKAAVSPRKISQ